MNEQNANPVELFGMRVAHVGINAADPADALEIAELFSTMMGLPVIETPVSYFNDSLVEIMKQNGRGAKGHIGFAKWIVDSHGGVIGVTSVEGVGSRFTIRLPR